MNAVEAIKTGKLCRPKGLDADWLAYDPPHGYGAHNIPVDWLFMDWEIMEPSVTITASKFWEAVAHSRNGIADDLRHPGTWIYAVASYLGLEAGR